MDDVIDYRQLVAVQSVFDAACRESSRVPSVPGWGGGDAAALRSCMLNDAIPFDPPLGPVSWSDRPADVVSRAPAITRGWDVRTRGPFELTAISLVTIPVSGVFIFRSSLCSVKLTPQSLQTRVLSRQDASQQFGAAVVARRGALVSAFGQPVVSAHYHRELPCPSATWTDGAVRCVHEVDFAIERGVDEEGWLIDQIVIDRLA